MALPFPDQVPLRSGIMSCAYTPVAVTPQTASTKIKHFIGSLPSSSALFVTPLSFRGEARRAEKLESITQGLWLWIPGAPLAPRNDSPHAIDRLAARLLRGCAPRAWRENLPKVSRHRKAALLSRHFSPLNFCGQAKQA